MSNESPDAMPKGWLLLCFLTSFLLWADAASDDSLCFGRNDTSKLTTLIDLVDGIVKEKCGEKQNATNTTTEPVAAIEPPQLKPLDCSDLKGSNKSSGVYAIWPQSRVLNGSIDVYCDMDDDDGGWTVIQRRGNFENITDYFNREWDDYKIGFGNITQDFWLGNNNIHALTNQRNYSIKFDLRDWNESTAYATYTTFFIENEYRSYTLHVEDYNGTAGDSFGRHNEYPFSTRDRDQSNNKCTVSHKGAWWFFRSPACEHSNLNGQYWHGKVSSCGGVSWATFKGYYYSLKEVVIKIRPRPAPVETDTTDLH